MAACRRIELFGGLRIIDGDRAITHFITQKTAALLAFLAYHRERAHLRESLIEMLWPWAPPPAGRQSLSTSLSSLRHQLEPLGVPPRSVLLADRNTVRLNPETTTSDVAEFEAALVEAAKAESFPRKAEHLAAAIALYRGDLLPDLFEAWITPEAERLAEHYSGAVVTLVDTLVRRGDTQGAISHLQHAIAVAPHREEPRRQLMRLRVTAGEPPAAPCIPPRPSAPPPLPAGTVTFLAVRAASSAFESRHGPSALRGEVRRHGGVEVEVSADGASLLAVFSRAGDALNCAAACQISAGTASPAMAVHTTEVAVGAAGSYPQGALDHVRRLRAAANPAQVLCSATAAGLVRYELNGGLHVRELGTYRLHDSGPPERLFAVDYPGGPEAQAPLGAESVHVSRLPVRLTRFFGRQSEMAQIEDLLADRTQLVTLVGAPGCGKTRLAIEVAERMLGAFAGRVWFVPLADVPEGGDVLDSALGPLGITRSSHATPLKQIAAVLASNPALIVLDNCEHLLAGAAGVGALLHSLPQARCLVTSRRRLGIQGEESLGVDPLPIPSGELLASLLANESIQLFLDRAQAAQPDFRLSAGNAGVVAGLCRRLEGIPLAIELAAARLNVLTPAQIAERLGRADVLKSRSREDEARHRTLKAAVEWSYGLLAPDLQRFFARLSVFSGGCTAEAAKVVCAEPLAEDYLSELAEWSLVHLDPLAPAVARGTPAATVYGMYASLQECAREKLEEMGPLAERETEERHGRWCAQFGDEAALAALELHGGIDRQRELGREIENLIVACRRAVERGDGDTAVGTYMAAWPVLDLAGPFSTGIALGARVMSLPLAKDRQARVLRTMGMAELRSGRMEEAGASFRSALALAREVNDRTSEGIVHHNLGNLAREQGRMDEALAHYDSALAIARTGGDRRSEGLIHGGLGNLYYELGRMDSARSHYEAALAIHCEVGNRRLEGVLLGNLGSLHREQGRMDEARSHYEAALAIHREVGNRRVEGFVLRNLGSVHRRGGRIQEARGCFDAALAIARELGDRLTEGTIRNSLGNLVREQGRMEEARSHYEAALAIAGELHDRRRQGHVLGNLGLVDQAVGRMDEARACFEAGLAIALELADRRSEGNLRNNLGLVLQDLGRLGEAQSHYDAALVIARELGDRHLEASARSNMGGLLDGHGRMDEARAHYDAALTIARDLGDRHTEGIVLGNLGSLSRRQGRIAEARELLARGEAALRAAGHLRELAKVLCERTDLELARGDISAAAASVNEAERLVAQLGAEPLSELGQRLVRLREVVAAR